jgi:diguanylate cyclase (GGDEF)-like protein
MVLVHPPGGFIYRASDAEAMFYAQTCRPVISEVTGNVLDRILAYWGQFSIAPPSANRVTIISSHERDEMSLEQTYGRIDPLCIPLAVQNRIMGVLSIDGVPDQSDRNDLTALLYIVGGQAASAIDRASQHHHVKSLSLTDWLTRLLNRRALHDRLQQEFDRARRYRSSLSLIMLDIDYFKKVNDIYGHQQGDAILRGLAGILIEESRRSDILARYGGEEFIIVLPETTLTNARQLAERLRMRVESHSFQLPMGQSLKITISLGVAALPHTGVTDEESLIREADLALYRAKGEGRNRVSTIDKGL